MLRVRIDDRALLKLIETWLKAGVLETEEHVGRPATATPQGGTVSPVLAHASWHDAMAVWCTTVGKAPWRGAALMCRDAADRVCALRDQDDAERLYRVLPERLEQGNRQVAPEKPRLLRVSRLHPGMKRRCTCPGCAMTMFCAAEASTTEEPDAGKPPVRVCTGGAGEPAFLP